MNISKSKSHTILKPIYENGGKKVKSILAFNKEFNKNYHIFKNENLILDFSEYNNIELKEILLFSQKNLEHKNNNKSFVIVYSGMDFDDVTNELIVVPTLEEAEDIIEIEKIERDLGI